MTPDERHDENTPTQAALDEAEAQIAKADEARDAVRALFENVAKEFAELGILNRSDRRLGSETEEIAIGAADEADDIIMRMLDRMEIRSAHQLLEGH